MKKYSSNLPLEKNFPDLLSKAQEVYSELKKELEADKAGKYIAIEVETGEYFIGDTREEAVLSAKKKFPDKIMFVRRIGKLDTAASHNYIPSVNYINNARIL